jgi:ribosomal protein S18 acetylase RimI-like enzyme
MKVTELNEVSNTVVSAFERLIPQLNPHCPLPSYEAILSMLSSGGIVVFLAWEGSGESEIIGTATLVTYETPTGQHGWVEDVVVDRQARGKGVGRALTEACLDKARLLGLREVNLTSRPEREAANRLYHAMGFEPRETNVYRYSLQ